jgi:ribosomal protein S18 acetylase RimI-like enzyme
MSSFVPATVADIPLLQRLSREIWHEHYTAIISVEQIDHMLGVMYASAVIEKEMAAGRRWELIQRDGETVGYVSYSFDLAKGLCTLHKLYVQVKHHGQGLGRAGLAHVMEAAAAAGAREVSLFVNKRNSKAIRAYERAGFTVAESVVTPFDGFVMDDFRMTAPVNPQASG